MALCRPVLEYGSAVWDPHTKSQAHTIEMIKNRAIRFICSIKGRETSITNARSKIKLEMLEKRRKDARIRMLLRMMEGKHPMLKSFIERETTSGSRTEHETRSQQRHLLRSIQSNSNAYHQSFLPRCIRDIRGEVDQPSSLP